MLATTRNDPELFGVLARRVDRLLGVDVEITRFRRKEHGDQGTQRAGDPFPEGGS